jgi:hypothetical protein
MIFILLYLLLCVFVGFLGRKQPLGLVGYTLLAFFLTPFVALLVLLFLLFNTKLAIRDIENSKKRQNRK